MEEREENEIRVGTMWSVWGESGWGRVNPAPSLNGSISGLEI